MDNIYFSDKAEVDSTTTAASSTSTPAAQTSASTSVPSKSTSVTGEEMDTSPPLNTGDFVGNILAKMRAEGFEVSGRKIFYRHVYLVHLKIIDGVTILMKRPVCCF